MLKKEVLEEALKDALPYITNFMEFKKIINEINFCSIDELQKYLFSMKKDYTWVTDCKIFLEKLERRLKNV